MNNSKKSISDHFNNTIDVSVRDWRQKLIINLLISFLYFFFIVKYLKKLIYWIRAAIIHGETLRDMNDDQLDQVTDFYWSVPKSLAVFLAQKIFLKQSGFLKESSEKWSVKFPFEGSQISLRDRLCPDLSTTEAYHRRRLPEVGRRRGRHRRWRQRFSGLEEGRHRHRHGYFRNVRLKASSGHDPARRQLRLHRRRHRRGPTHLRQLEEVHRLHPDLQHSGSDSLLALHFSQHTSAIGHGDNFVHWPWNWHGSCHLTGLRKGRMWYYEKATKELSHRQTGRWNLDISRLWPGVNITTNLFLRPQNNFARFLKQTVVNPMKDIKN